MKAISLHQPWASLVILGAKRFETRSWKTEYRGPLAIHATARISKKAANLCVMEPFYSALAPARPTVCDGSESAAEVSGCPLGAVLGVVELVECIPAESLWDAGKGFQGDMTRQEWDFGDFRPGRWAWRLKVLKRFGRPIPMAGRLGLWECDERLLPE